MPIKDIDFILIWKKLNGELEKKEEQALQQWMSADDTHQKYFNVVKKYFEEGSSFDEVPYDQKAGWRIIKRRISNTLHIRLGVAAAVALVILCSIFLFKEVVFSDQPDKIAGTSDSGRMMLITSTGEEYVLEEGQSKQIQSDAAIIKSDGELLEYTRSQSETAEIAMNTIITPKGKNIAIQLADGTKVWLNTDSKLIFPELFAEGERSVILSGEAYFEVNHDENQPFYVRSEDQEIAVLGTSFNVSAYSEDRKLVTTLVEGKVKVVNNAMGDQLELDPNQQSILDLNNGKLIKQDVDPYQYVVWREETFYFEDKTLKEIMNILSRWYDVKVFFKNRKVENVLFTGRFKRYEDLSVILNKIEKTNEVKFEVKDDKIIIR